MYRLSPFTYLVAGFLATGVANTKVTCADNEYLRFYAPSGLDCGTYMSTYISKAGGYLLNNATSACEFCTVADTNVFLASINAQYDQRWRNWGIMWAYVIFNIAAALGLYWFFRMPKGTKNEDKAGKLEEKNAGADGEKKKKGLFSFGKKE